MANEATLFVETDVPVPFTVADGAGIEKGTVLKMTDPMTAAASDGANDVVAGIAASEKIASDGKTRLGVYQRGYFKMTLSGTATTGDPLGTQTGGGGNHVASIASTSGLSGLKRVGYACEDATDGQTLLVYVNVGYHN